MEKPGRSPWRVSAAKRELRHQQQFAVDLPQTQVHLAGFVGENAVFEQPVEQFGARRLVILGTDPHECQQSRSNRGGDFAADFNARAGDALKQGDHGSRRICLERAHSA